MDIEKFEKAKSIEKELNKYSSILNEANEANTSFSGFVEYLLDSKTELYTMATTAFKSCVIDECLKRIDELKAEFKKL